VKAILPVFLLGALSLAGCNDSPPVHTSLWYADHDKERLQRLDQCDRLGIADRGADCANATGGAVLRTTRSDAYQGKDDQ
jgi:hypothetical protein